MHGFALLAAPFMGLACCGVAHIAAAKVLRGTRMLLVFVASFGVGLATCAAIAAIGTAESGTSWLDRAGHVVTALLTYGGLTYCYINFVNVAIASLRVRVLTELAAAPEGVAAEALIEEYGVREVIGVRLVRLEQAGQLTSRDGRFHHRTSPIYFLALGMSALKRLVLGVAWGRDLE